MSSPETSTLGTLATSPRRQDTHIALHIYLPISKNVHDTPCVFFGRVRGNDGVDDDNKAHPPFFSFPFFPLLFFSFLSIDFRSSFCSWSTVIVGSNMIMKHIFLLSVLSVDFSGICFSCTRTSKKKNALIHWRVHPSPVTLSVREGVNGVGL